VYVAVKGGEEAIEASHRLLASQRRGDPQVPELSLVQIEQQLALLVDRVMGEASLYDRELAALAIKQACGDPIEAVFLLRAFRTTLPRFGASRPVDTGAMTVRRRISATFKDMPGGQILGATFDYTHRLLDFDLGGFERAPQAPRANLARPGGETASGLAVERVGAMPVPDQLADSDGPAGETPEDGTALPRVMDVLEREGLVEAEPPDDESRSVGDLTREPLIFPANRDLRLQSLARADEGFLLALGYATQRGYGRNHPFAAEIRLGEVVVEMVPEELGFVIEIAEITVTECQMVNQFRGSATVPPQFTRGYGLSFGNAERKAMAMALVDRALRAPELGEESTSPTQDQEFVLSHGDNVEASGFVQHLKLPHHVDFQSELVLVRTLRAQADAGPRP
jgi:alpha-D-ribose 1-methylphosphonate 5-triphosphate synthase subunit PhnI